MRVVPQAGQFTCASSSLRLHAAFEHVPTGSPCASDSGAPPDVKSASDAATAVRISGVAAPPKVTPPPLLIRRARRGKGGGVAPPFPPPPGELEPEL